MATSPYPWDWFNYKNRRALPHDALHAKYGQCVCLSCCRQREVGWEMSVVSRVFREIAYILFYRWLAREVIQPAERKGARSGLTPLVTV